MSQTHTARYTCSHTEQYTLRWDGSYDRSVRGHVPDAVDHYLGTLCQDCIGEESTYFPSSPPNPDHSQPFVPSEIFARIPMIWIAFEDSLRTIDNDRLSKPALAYIKDVYRHLEMQMRWKRYGNCNFEKKREKFIKSNIIARHGDDDLQENWEMEWKEHLEKGVMRNLSSIILHNSLHRAHNEYLKTHPEGCCPPLLTTPSNDSSDEECHICQSPMNEESGEKPCQLPCSHRFGDKCIGTWLQEQESCPLCRVVFKRDDYSYPAVDMSANSGASADEEEPYWVLVIRGVIQEVRHPQLAG
jgi:hypothetical protein